MIVQNMCPHGQQWPCVGCAIERTRVETYETAVAVARADGRLAGIREAIAIVDGIGLGCESCIAEALARLSALLPTPSGGDKAECT